MRGAVRRMLLTAQVDRFMRRTQQDRLIILMYHGFVDDSRAEGEPRGGQVGIARFAEQMQYLARHHQVISVADWVEALEYGRETPRYPVAITMDDGYESNYKLAFPVLEAQRFPATLAVTTGFVGGELLWNDRVEWAITRSSLQSCALNLGWGPFVVELNSAEQRRQIADTINEKLKTIPQEQRLGAIETLEGLLGTRLSDAQPVPAHCRPLTWEQIKEMASSGLVTLANHTRDHYILSRCTATEEARQIDDAHADIRRHVGIECQLFCFPNGQRDDFSERTIAALTQRGYRVALTTELGTNTRDTGRLELARYAVVGNTTLDDFRLLLYGGLRQFGRELARS